MVPMVVGASLLVTVLLPSGARRTVLSLPLLLLSIGVLIDNGVFRLMSDHPGPQAVTNTTVTSSAT